MHDAAVKNPASDFFASVSPFFNVKAHNSITVNLWCCDDTVKVLPILAIQTTKQTEHTLTGGSGFLGWANLARPLGRLLDLWCGPGFSQVLRGLLGSMLLRSVVLFGWDWDLVEGLGLCLDLFVEGGLVLCLDLLFEGLGLCRALGFVLGCIGVLRFVGGEAGGVWLDGLVLDEIIGLSLEGEAPRQCWAFPFLGMVPVEWWLSVLKKWGI